MMGLEPTTCWMAIGCRLRTVVRCLCAEEQIYHDTLKCAAPSSWYSGSCRSPRPAAVRSRRRRRRLRSSTRSRPLRRQTRRQRASQRKARAPLWCGAPVRHTKGHKGSCGRLFIQPIRPLSAARPSSTATFSTTRSKGARAVKYASFGFRIVPAACAPPIAVSARS
jgi:hypothetical protein